MAMHKLRLLISIEKREIGLLQFTSVASQGETRKRAIENLKEALELFLNDEDVLRQYSAKIKNLWGRKKSGM
ncbi:type II toxin-antitoxin system HicB family antitoxin [Methanothermobacter tenebrarum]|uniref:type II toxin-antitoxin system HicB family antitoxin n=1 Tax=Methanothermobacter tenebrarum TaxID=680118 RepID=UPI001C65965E|nr:type II toxin-antitoxin system HicB family antitoxin [Methanothermobacter tenebrarum]